MPVDASMVDAILGTFRTMSQELKDKGIDTPDAKAAHDVLQKMEDLAQEMDDMTAYSTKLGVDGLFTDFSNAYGKALAAGAAESSSGDQSDDQLMATTLKAYEDALNTLKENPANAHIVPTVQRVVDLGKSGMSYPLFLKACEEEGVFLGLDSPHAGPTIAYDIYCYELAHQPAHVRMYKKMQEVYNQLVEKAPFSYPDPVEWEINRQKIEWQYAPELALYDAITDRWERLLTMVDDWVDSFCKFAPYDDRWAGMGGTNSAAITQKNIERTQECDPGRIKVREDIFKEYFGLGWNDIFSHETYTTQLNARLLWYSDERLDFLREVHEVMKPGGRPTPEMIAQAESMHDDGSKRRKDCITAEDMKPMPFADFLKDRGFV